MIFSNLARMLGKATVLSCVMIASLIQARVVFAQPISVQTFNAPAADYGEQVATPLPIYKVHVDNGKLVDEGGNVFNSYRPQSTSPTDRRNPNTSGCNIRNLGWPAFYTTFYVVLKSDQSHMLLVKSCGKSPLKLNSTDQYSNIKFIQRSGFPIDTNFINHAQIAGLTNGIGNPVIAAGEIDIIDGKIVYMDTCSGHFKPNVGSLLAYMSRLDSSKPVALTSTLKNIIATGQISDPQINANLTAMINDGSESPKRNVRAGTSNCNSYTTVFEYYGSLDNGGTVTLTGGLMAYQQGGIQVFQNDINTITNKNIKTIDLRSNFGIYSYSAYVTTDLHLWNNALDFEFTDETNDTYSLSIHNYSYNHEVDFNSDKPNIKKITFK